MLAGRSLADLPSLPSPDVGTDPKRYLILMGIGFAVGILGHLTRTKTLIAAGVALVFLATVALPFAFYLSQR